MKPNFTYRNIMPVYRIENNGDVFDTRTRKLVKPKKDTLSIKLENNDGSFTNVGIYSIYANTILGSRSLKNKGIAKMFYRKKFQIKE